MIKLRVMVTAFIMHGESVLLMKRAANRKFMFRVWAGVGGHLETHEINNPASACLREISEETGFSEADLSNLKLKYIILRRSVDEIRIQYVYFLATNKLNLATTDEGTLAWLIFPEAVDRNLSVTTRFALERYFTEGAYDENVYVGSVSAESGLPKMNWVSLQDWEG